MAKRHHRPRRSVTVPPTRARGTSLGPTPVPDRLRPLPWGVDALVRAYQAWRWRAIATEVTRFVPGKVRVGEQLWEQRIARTTQAALALIHQAQGNEAGLPAEAFTEARRVLWPELAVA